MNKYQVGDKLWIEVEITMADYRTAWVKFGDELGARDEEFCIFTDAAKNHIPAPRPLQVGDRCRWKNGGSDTVYTIRHIIGDEAWVSWGTSTNAVVKLSYLERL